MTEENANQAETTEEQRDEKQTVTAEQFAELQRQLEETKKAQSGSDRRVKELTDLLKEKEQKVADAEKSADEKNAERIAALEAKAEKAEHEARVAQLKSVAVGLLGEAGLKAPGYLDRLIGQNEEETHALISQYIEDKKETKLSAADEFAKSNGRKVTETKSQPQSVLDYTDEQIKAMSDDEFLRVMERAK